MKYFTKVDLQSVFWPIELGADSMLLTVFFTPQERNKYLLCSVFFQKSWQQPIEGMAYVSYIADDIIIFAITQVGHDTSLVML